MKGGNEQKVVAKSRFLFFALLNGGETNKYIHVWKLNCFFAIKNESRRYEKELKTEFFLWKRELMIMF